MQWNRVPDKRWCRAKTKSDCDPAYPDQLFSVIIAACVLFQWEAFSTPELKNFMIVLDREENEAIAQLQYKYRIMKRIIHQRMKELRKEKQAQSESTAWWRPAVLVPINPSTRKMCKVTYAHFTSLTATIEGHQDRKPASAFHFGLFAASVRKTNSVSVATWLCVSQGQDLQFQSLPAGLWFGFLNTSIDPFSWPDKRSLKAQALSKDIIVIKQKTGLMRLESQAFYAHSIQIASS